MKINGFETRTVSLDSIVVDVDKNIRTIDFNHVNVLKNAMLGYGIIVDGSDEPVDTIKAGGIKTAMPQVPATDDDNGDVLWQTAFAQSGGMLKTVEIDGKLHLYSGFHTHTAATELFGGAHEIAVLVNTATKLPEACLNPALLSGGENVHGGKKRTSAEKREAVRRWLKNRKTWKYTDAFIAKMTNVSPRFVGKMDEELRKKAEAEGKKYRRPNTRIAVNKKGEEREIKPGGKHGKHEDAVKKRDEAVAQTQTDAERAVLEAAAQEFPNQVSAETTPEPVVDAEPEAEATPEANETTIPQGLDEASDEPIALAVTDFSHACEVANEDADVMLEAMPEGTQGQHEDDLEAIYNAIDALKGNRYREFFLAHIAPLQNSVMQAGTAQMPTADDEFSAEAELARDEEDDALETLMEAAG